MVGTISQSIGGNLQDLLRSLREGRMAEETPEALAAQIAAVADSGMASANASSSQAMARNFASAKHEESKHLSGTKAAFKAGSDMANRQSAILSIGLTQLNALSGGDEDSYAMRNLIGQRAARQIMRERQQTVLEESERNLKEMAEHIEERAQESTAPKEETGAPSEGLPAGSAGQGAPMPVVPEGDFAPPPEFATAPAPELEAMPAQVPAGSTPVPPSAPSVDIMV